MALSAGMPVVTLNFSMLFSLKKSVIQFKTRPGMRPVRRRRHSL
jgi:hypothetical protein